MNLNTMSKMALAFAVGVALSAGYVALGTEQATPPEIIVVQERCERCEQRAVSSSDLLPRLPDRLAHDPPYYVTDRVELAAMARRCEIRDDDPIALDEAIADLLGLSAVEREAWERAQARVDLASAEIESALLREIDPDGDANRTLTELLRDRQRQFESDHSIVRQLAEERAGLREPMTPEQLEQSDVWTRALRFQVSTGDRFAAELEIELGRDRVEELRRKFAGWPGSGVRLIACSANPETEPATDGMLVAGSLEQDAVRRVVRAHLPDVQECYERRAAPQGEAKEKLVVKFVIGTDGTAGQVSFANESTLHDLNTRLCVSLAVQRWVFPKPRRGVVQVTYPIEFAPN